MSNNIPDSIYPLIDRLKACSELKYPNRKWSNEFYHSCAFEWIGKETALLERVLRLERETKDLLPQ